MTDYSNRNKWFTKVVKLPKVYIPEDRGMNECCCDPFPVFGSASGNSWEKDQTSAWIKDTDTVSFFLEKSDGTTIPQTTQVMPNDLEAKFCTVDWSTVLVSNGIGCYTLKITYSISGVTDTIVWGVYQLEPYSFANKSGLVRMKIQLDSYHKNLNINFKGSGIIDCLNFPGIFRGRKPNMETENLVYSSRFAKKTRYENLNTYTLKTEPIRECLSSRLLDLYFLGANEIWISDHNRHNHSYKYLDWPVILEESPDAEEKDRFCVITATFGDRKKDQITSYGV